MRFGCQTYSWEMMGDKWRGTQDDILDTVAAAGYDGIEFSNNRIGPYWERPRDLEKALADRGLKLAAFAYATTGFTDPARYEQDLAGADRALELADHFGCVLGLGGPSSDSRDNYDAKLAQAIRFYLEVTKRADKAGVTAAVHPHSHHTSLALTADEYDRLLSATAQSGIRFNPDSGHILRGGQDLLDCFKRYRDRIAHVHLKDVTAEGKWVRMGNGSADFPGLFDWLGQIGYSGWVVIEEESDSVWQDVGAAVAANCQYVRPVEMCRRQDLIRRPV